MAPQFPFTEQKMVRDWANYHGTVTDRDIPMYLTPDVITELGVETPKRMARHGAALSAILDHCFTAQPPLAIRTIGGRWSLSNIIKPDQVILDLANMNAVMRVKSEWLTDTYRAERAAHFTPVFVQGGVHISSINRRLGEAGLALQTSGASDGHRIAGCIATGTHGSAIDVGAVHDTVLAIHLIVAPNKSYFIQPEDGACSDQVASWLQAETGIPTTPVRNNDWFNAATVSLGSLGIVHGVVFEAVPLYLLEQHQVGVPYNTPAVWEAIRTLDTRPFHPHTSERPFHFQVTFHPYPPIKRPGAFMTMYWKKPNDGRPAATRGPVAPELASDLMGFIGTLAPFLSGPVGVPVLRRILSTQLEQRYPDQARAAAHTGQVFGPTALPPGSGDSTEIVVNQIHAVPAIKLLMALIAEEAKHGRPLMGGVAIRFVPKTRALLGMNIHDMNVYIEIAGIRTPHMQVLYRNCWNALERNKIPFTCHWGQRLELNRKRLETYFGDRVARWEKARSEMLETAISRSVFASPLLAEVGLK